MINDIIQHRLNNEKMYLKNYILLEEKAFGVSAT